MSHTDRVVSLLAAFTFSLLASAESLPQRLDLGDPDGATRVERELVTAGAPPLACLEAPLERAAGRGLAYTLIGNASDEEGDTPTDIAYTSDGLRIVVAHRDSRNLIVFDAVTRTVLDVIELSGSPHALAISSDGVHAITANVFEGTASIVDLTAGAEVQVIPVGLAPGVARIRPAGDLAAIGNTGSASISIIDLASGAELRRVPGTAFTNGGSLAPEPGVFAHIFSQFEFAGNDRIVHPDYFGNRILIVDVNSGAITPIASNPSPRDLAVTPDGAKAVVVHFTTTNISVVDVPAATITKTINIGASLFGPIAINPDGSKAIVDVQNAVRVVNLATNALSPTISTLGVFGLINTADGLHAQVVGFSGALVSYASESVVSSPNNVLSPDAGAVSPVTQRSAFVGHSFNENMAVMRTNGAGGGLLGSELSGPPPEADKTRKVAISADGARAVSTNILSDSATIYDLTQGAVLAVVPVGDRPGDVAITPDGSTAVVANLDSTFVSVIDLATQSVTNVTTSTRNSEVEISPDGAFAYVAVVVDDGVWRIDLSGPAVAGPRRTTGNMGGIGYSFSQTSGMTLSHDGLTLATCDSFSNSVTLLDTGSWTVVKTVTVNGFPVRALFSADDQKIYVTSRDNDRVSVLSNAGAASAVLSTITVGDWPSEMALSAAGDTLYVCNFLGESIGVVDLATAAQVTTIPLPAPAEGVKYAGEGRLLASSGEWSVTFGGTVTLNRFGQFSIIDTTTNSVTAQVETQQPPAMLAYSAATERAYIAVPFGDGLLEFNVAPPCEGDLDGDGDVDIVDIATLISNFGVGSTPAEGDLDEDGDVDIEDLAAIISLYASDCA